MVNNNINNHNEQKQRLYQHLREIVRPRDPFLASGGHFFVREYIRSQFQQWGEVSIHEFQEDGKIYQNLILNLPGKEDKPPILIGAHFDAVPNSPGADDNASGVAVLLELGREFAMNPPQYPMRLVAFDLEEYGLLGSAAYAAQLKEEKQPLRLMFSLEMLGYCTKETNSQIYPPVLKYFYPSKGDFITFVGNISTIPDLIHFSRNQRKLGIPSEWLFVPNQGKLVRATRFSDHSPFWDRGYKAIMVTDTAFLRNPHYHKSTDTIDTLDLDFMTDVCQGLITGIYKL